jgi:hypothetical protein
VTQAEIVKAGKALARRSRRAQGLPGKVVDRKTARRIAAVMMNTNTANGKPDE